MTGGGGHIFDMIGRLKANEALLKKRRYFDFHQKIIQKYYLGSKNRKRSHKKLTAKQISRIRKKLENENSLLFRKKIIAFMIAALLSIFVVYCLSQIILKYYF